jgi:hypothetical protein
MKTNIASIAHSAKTFDGELGQLRELIKAAVYPQPFWYEVAKSRQAFDCARTAMEKRADLIFV